jgi:hypothetical protein
MHLFKTHPRFQDRVNKLIAYHEEHFETLLPDDLYAEIEQMNTSDYPGERVLRKSIRPVLALIQAINSMKKMAKQAYPSL